MTACKQFVLSLCILGTLALPAAHAAESSPAFSEQVTIADVQVRISDHGIVVLLLAEGKAIPIFVDLTVALSIQSALNGEKLPRTISCIRSWMRMAGKWCEPLSRLKAAPITVR